MDKETAHVVAMILGFLTFFTLFAKILIDYEKSLSENAILFYLLILSFTNVLIQIYLNYGEDEKIENQNEVKENVQK